MQSLDRLKSPEPGQLPNAMKNLKVGETYQALVQPTVTKWTGLTSSATQQIKDADGNVVSALIVDVLDAADAPLTKVYTGAPGAGEVKITFDSDGQPLLTFNAAVTAFGIYGVIFPYESVSNQTKELL